MSVVLSRPRALLLGAFVALCALLLPATPAFAHDQLLSSTPEAGERLDSPPSEVVMEFSGNVLAIGAAVIVVDEEGRDWAAGEPELDGTRVTVPLEEGMTDAGFEVRWRVVSSDGHPVSGIIPFTLGDGEPLAQGDGSAVEAEPGEGTGAGDAEEGQTDEQGGVPRAVLVGVIGAAVATAAFALTVFVRRRRARPGGTGSSADAG
ncbi:copper resistance CopC family protein [Actinoalloteichus spitiensis]|uniref:copper resistance CopC family protein n=1 Tax=Actinoalloteichus spitiensis TaxID=252394 RepID=UPI000370318F|nr:copper resistance CopC family protein [Actinoalloteichus spitiensis]